MAFRNYNLEELPTFGRRLLKEARDHDLDTPSLIAVALYEKCYDLVKPGKRKNKHGKDVHSSQNDIKAIIKFVQAHLNEEHPYNVQSKYIFAYCKLFDCSSDYLLSFTNIRTNNMDIRQICDKTKLSEEAVKRIINSPIQTVWWSKLFETSLFIDLPIGWSRMFMELQIRHLKLKNARPEKEIMDELKNAGKLSQKNLIMHPSYRASIDAETADSAYYGRLAKINAQITEYFLKGTVEQYNSAVKRADSQ